VAEGQRLLETGTTKYVLDNSIRSLIPIEHRLAIQTPIIAPEILDVTKIDDQLLRMNKEYFNLKELVLDLVHDHKRELQVGHTRFPLAPTTVLYIKRVMLH